MNVSVKQTRQKPKWWPHSQTLYLGLNGTARAQLVGQPLKGHVMLHQQNTPSLPGDYARGVREEESEAKDVSLRGHRGHQRPGQSFLQDLCV